MIADLLDSLRYWWARRSGRDTVDITVRLKTLSYQQFERVCLRVGLDPDDVRTGQQSPREADVDDVFEDGEALIKMTCANAGTLTQLLRSAEKPAAEHMVAQVITHFFFQSVRRFSEQNARYRITPTGAPSRPS